LKPFIHVLRQNDHKAKKDFKQGNNYIIIWLRLLSADLLNLVLGPNLARAAQRFHKINLAWDWLSSRARH
jgi:hypothetical protein